MSQASLCMVSLFGAGRGRFSPGFHSMLFHVLIQQEALPLKRESESKNQRPLEILQCPGRPSVNCFPRQLGLFHRAPSGEHWPGFRASEKQKVGLASLSPCFFLLSRTLYPSLP